MASHRNYFPTHFQSPNSASNNHRFEFEESDIWSSDAASDHTKDPPIRSASRSWKNKPTPRKTPSYSPAASSLPVNVPDWSKILGASTDRWSTDDPDADFDHGDEEEEDEEEDRVPPHEYAARQVARRSGMVVAFSLHEGVGRTLKGRDLRRVRNAIWKQTGFED